MEEATGGELFARALKAHGIQHVFALCGGHVQGLLDASLDEGLRVIDTRHEQAAVSMAEGWAWVTGQPGFATVTAGPGVTNAMTGLVNAHASGVPLLLLGGRISLNQFDTRTLQDLDQLPLVERFTRSARAVYDGSRVPEYVARALSAATAAPQGPSYLEVPADQLQRRHLDPGPLAPPAPHPRPFADPDALDRAAEALRRARRPVCIAGSGVHWSQASDALRRFAETTGIPVFTHKGARGALSDDHPLCLGPAFPDPNGLPLTVLPQADAVFVVGARLDFTLAGGMLFARDAAVIRADLDPQEPSRNRQADVALMGDARSVLDQLTDAVGGGGQQDPDWVPGLRAARAATEARHRAEVEACSSIHPMAVPHAVNDVLGGQGVVAADGGDILTWCITAAKAFAPGGFLAVGPMGTLGVGLPFALAAKLARPSEPVVLICGDGSFGFNAMELDTAVRHGLPVVVVISNDQAWGMVKHGQGITYGYERVVASELGDARYDRLAQALGGEGYLVEDRADLRPSIEAALECGRPAVVDVRVDREIVSPVTRLLASAVAT